MAIREDAKNGIDIAAERGAARVVAVVVSYNRHQHLNACVQALKKQVAPVDTILVVDQSDDMIARSEVDKLQGITLIRQSNQGGAGGFVRGLVYAWQQKFDWAWLMDDDVVPDEDALRELLRTPYARRTDTGFLTCRIVDSSGLTYMTPGPSHWEESRDTILHDACYRVAGASFVGFLVSYRAIDACGLPFREYFIWDDDTEYSERLARRFRGYCVLSSVVVHNQPPASAERKRTVNWKELHLARNRTHRILISDAPFGRKFIDLTRHFARSLATPTLAAAVKKVPYWLLWGLFFFRPKIRFADEFSGAHLPDS